MKSYILVLVFLFNGFNKKGNTQELYEGDNCELKTKEIGVCVKLTFCPHAQDMIFQKYEHPVSCGFVKNIPIVCCPKMNTTYTNLAEQKCELYNQPVLGIILGEDAKPKEFPHMAALGYEHNNKKEWLCGGTLISEKYILTAAHCLRSSEFGSVKHVRVGIVDINEPENTENSIFENYQVNKTIAHPLYKPPLTYHDIGLIELDRDVIIGPFVRPACLYTQDVISEETKLMATGWGLTQISGNRSQILQKVSLDLFSKEECDLNYNSARYKRKLKNGILHEQQLCAGGKNIGTDTCQGDSGGPLQFKKVVSYNGIFYIVGITSFGKSCGIENVPGVYIRVSNYVPWIENVIWPNEL